MRLCVYAFSATGCSGRSHTCQSAAAAQLYTRLRPCTCVTVALELWNEEKSAVRAIFPVVVGPTIDQGFSPFPFAKLCHLSDSPSKKTNKVAAMILSRLGVAKGKIDRMRERSVRRTVELILRHQGIHASEYKAGYGHFGPGPATAFVEACAIQVLRTLHVGLRVWKGDPEQFRNSRPMAHEVLEFLSDNGVSTFAAIFASHDLDTLAMVAALPSEHIQTLIREHHEMYPLCSRLGSTGAQMNLQMAVQSLQGDCRAMSLRQRLDEYRDSSSSAMAVITAGNTVEIVYLKPSLRLLMFILGAGLVTWAIIPIVLNIYAYKAEGCATINGCNKNVLWFISHLVYAVSILAAALSVLLPLLQPTAHRAFRVLRFFFCLYVLLLFAADVGRSFLSVQNVMFVVLDLTNFGGVFVMFYRQSWVSVYAFFVIPLVLFCRSLVDCWSGDDDYELCLRSGITYNSLVVGSFVVCLLYLSTIYVVNLFTMRRRYAPTLMRYRYLWHCETNKRHQLGGWEADKTLCDLADSIIAELKRQRTEALNKLSAVNRFSAWCNRKRGRMCLRDRRPKALQPHDSIDLLFLEAAEVSMLCMYAPA